VTSSVGNITPTINDWSNTQNNIHKVNEFYVNELNYALGLITSTLGSKTNPCLAFWIFQTQCLPATTQSSEYQMQLESDALDIATFIRNSITNAQNAYNTLISDIENGYINNGAPPGTPNAVTAAHELSTGLNQISSDLHIKNMTKILGGSNLSTIEGFIQMIRSNAQGNVSSFNQTVWHTLFTTTVCWNGGWSWADGVAKVTKGPGKNCHTIHPPKGESAQVVQVPGINNAGFLTYLEGIYQRSIANGQPLPGAFSNITSGFNGAVQSVSGISSNIQAQMQYLNQNLQQYFGIYKSIFDDYSNLTSYIVSKSTQS
jgi:hypothetical protein